MPQRFFTLGLILFQLVWFNLIVPGHQRGMMLVPGTDASRRSCCSGGDERSSHKPMTPEQRAQHCAICYFCGHIGMPPSVTMAPVSLGLLCKVQPDRQDDLCARRVLLPFDCCGPPAFS